MDKQQELAALQQELAELQSMAKAKGISSEPNPVMTAAKDAAMNALPGVKAGAALMDASSGVRRAVTTGVGSEIGRMAGPVGAGVGAVAGSLVADAVDNPEATKKVLAGAAQSILPGSQGEVAQSIISEIQNMDPKKAKDFVLEKAVTFGTSAALAGAAQKAVKGVKGTESPAAIAFKDPAMALDKTRQAVFKAHNKLKGAYMKQDEAFHIAETMEKVSSPEKAVKFIGDAFQRIKDQGGKFTNTEQLFLREAARKVSKAKGGTASQIAGKVFSVVDRKLKQSNPALWNSFKRAERAVKIAGDEKPFGLLEIAQAAKNPYMSAASNVTGKAAGVVGRGITETIPSAGTLTAEMLQKFAAKRREGRK